MVVDVDGERAEPVAADVAGLAVAADVAREDDVEGYEERQVTVVFLP